MLLTEIYSREPAGYQDTTQDNSQIQLGDKRKTRFTLRQIHKLRMMNDIRAVEYQDKLKLVRQQYAPPAAAPGM